VAHRSDGHGARPLENEGVRSDGYWGRARPAAHASGSEAVATLATAGRKDGAAGAGAHPQTEAVGLVPTTVVRLERALAQRVHSTRGAWLTVRSPGRVVRVTPVVVDQHRSPTTLWTVVDMRHRSTPVTTCQRYVLAVNRVNSASSPERRGVHPVENRRNAGGPGRVFRADTPQSVDIAPASLWTTVDPQAREALASMVPGNPNSTDRPS